MKVELIDSMGNDNSVVDAARVSFTKQAGNYTEEANKNLISYLALHNHWTPFAHTSISLRMQAPIPIRTQCFKHKQGFIENEESRRYISSTPEFFIPEFRSRPEGSIKQGSAGIHEGNDYHKRCYVSACQEAIQRYEYMLKDGVSPEQARFVLPQGCEVNWVWTGNVYSYANFFNKRSDPHAQKEIQELALMVSEHIKLLFPISWEALTNEKIT